ncbi:MAG: hypothetical protein WDN30_10840 [Pararobbsia sp.]
MSSLIEENRLLDFVPVLKMVKQNYGDQPLSVPEAVRKCVHFAAAHELRFYQRLDSLEKTRGDQYLYPGSSEDITGGAPPGSLGFRAELQRVALRDMLNEALTAGAAVNTIEELFVYSSPVFSKFTLAHALSDGSTRYKIPDLINAYRSIVPREKGLDFHAHMLVFPRWLAVRYPSPAFRISVTGRADSMNHPHRALAQQRADAATSHQAEPDPMVSVWQRVSSEAAEVLQRHAMQAGLEESADRIRRMGREGRLPHGVNMEQGAHLVEASMVRPETLALVQAWQDGVGGKQPLPPQVMALFDLLVHDTLFTSWYDHILSPMLYFRTRATDTFGTTDFEDEAKQRVVDERHAQRVDQLPKADDARAGTGL